MKHEYDVQVSRRRFLKWSLASAAGALLGPRLLQAQESQTSPVLGGLVTAHSATVAAQVQCLAAAQQAETEGYAGVATLFRAAAKTKEINAECLAKTIGKLGGKTAGATTVAKVGQTRENLAAFLQSEQSAQDNCFTPVMGQARREGNREALRALNDVSVASHEYSRLFGEVLNQLAQWRDAGKAIYVCAVCGFPALTKPEKKCPSCFVPREKFLKVT